MYKISYRDLVERIDDLNQLTTLPLPGEKSGTFSSYDRASRYDRLTDTYLDWGANQDSDGFLRLENGEYVVAEINHPGVIWRIWSAKPKDGFINFYFDGESKPSISRPFRQFFDQVTEDLSPAGFPTISPKLSGGYNSFIPISFSKSLKITFSEGWGQYYHITYTSYEKDISIEDFRVALKKDALKILAEKDRELYRKKFDNNHLVDQTNIFLKAKDTQCILNLPDPGEFQEFQISLLNSEITSDFLRNVILEIRWDHHREIDVQAPLGNFFGTISSEGKYISAPLAVTEKLTSRWKMPFYSAEISLVNQGNKDYDISFSYSKRNIASKIAASKLRFHAICHGDDFSNLDISRFDIGGDRWPDWPILSTKGKPGRFCGLSLLVENRWTEPNIIAGSWWNGHGNQKNIDWWWGEGDEKFFVDGEKFPSTFGTGSEDYVGYAWAAEPPFALFDSHFSNQSVMPINGNGLTCVSRYQICDNIPYQNEFQAFIEKYKANDWDGNICIYQVVPYWYEAAQ